MRDLITSPYAFSVVLGVGLVIVSLAVLGCVYLCDGTLPSDREYVN